jgi:hypothetical protein
MFKMSRVHCVVVGLGLPTRPQDILNIYTQLFNLFNFNFNYQHTTQY